MFRRLADFSRRLIDGVSQAIRDFCNILMLPFRGGFRPIQSLRRLLAEVRGLFIHFFRSLNPRNVSTVISRDSQSIVASSQMVAQQTTTTAVSVFKMILLSPIYFLRWLITAPARLWFFLKTRTWLQLGVGTVVIAVGVGAVAYPMYKIVRERRRDILRKEQERQLEENFVRGSLDGVRHNLNVIHNIVPADEIVNNRLAAMETGESPARDHKMAKLLMRYHYFRGRNAEAEREARKFIETTPDDWETLIILADLAVRRGDRAAAVLRVNQLPPARDLPPGVCLISDRVFRALNDREKLIALLEYIAEEHVPMVRRGVLITTDPGFQLQMVELYHLTLMLLPERPLLKGNWAPVQDVCHAIATAKESSPYVLVKLGTIQEYQLEYYLRVMLELQLITNDEYKQLSSEIENRLTLIWTRLRSAEPKHTMAIMGLALQQARAGQLAKALAIIDEGIQLCGEQPELIEKKADILRRLDPAACLTYLQKVLTENKTLTMQMCRVLAQSALTSNRPDLALDAVQKANAIQPNEPMICQLEAQALLRAGRASEAVGALRRIQSYLPLDPNALGLYVEALAASSAVDTAEQFLLEILKGDNSSLTVVNGADALARLGHLEPAVRILRAILREQRNNAQAQFYLAECLRQIAEKAPGPGWDRNLAAEAIQNYRKALDRSPKNWLIINNITWLELFALNLPRQAAETAKPLIVNKDLPAAMLQTIGAVHLSAGAYDQARVALETAIRKRGESATNTAMLAHAYFGLGRTSDALLYLRKSLNLPKANPRDAEIIESIRRIIERAGG